jgi:hypothetical protein
MARCRNKPFKNKGLHSFRPQKAALRGFFVGDVCKNGLKDDGFSTV